MRIHKWKRQRYNHNIQVHAHCSARTGSEGNINLSQKYA